MFQNRSRGMKGCYDPYVCFTASKGPLSAHGQAAPTRDSMRLTTACLSARRVPEMEELEGSHGFLNAHQLQHGYLARGLKKEEGETESESEYESDGESDCGEDRRLRRHASADLRVATIPACTDAATPPRP
jgi:hypothetical protein